ncbi:hypothetical protein ACTWQF_35260 [Streptomyces sp. 8N114]|uniref:hypothetical protein n=1 Tax=Streptomyces sp. 8N114 TaxID=3457419 RepID=UPI003FD34A75
MSVAWRDAWPLAAQPDDGNQWLTGVCWLYCRREAARVLWVGSVRTPGAIGDVYACGPCVAELDHMVRNQSHGRDGVEAAGHRAGACEHWRIEKRGGKTRCQDCKRQLYL